MTEFLSTLKADLKKALEMSRISLSEAKTIGEYMEILSYRAYVKFWIAMGIVTIVFSTLLVIELINKGNPAMMLIWLGLFVMCIGLYFQTDRYLSRAIWKVQCPECGIYIPMYQWSCDPPCAVLDPETQEEQLPKYTDRNILQGCKECGRTVGPEKTDLNHIECRCGYKLYFYEPYEIKPGSIKSKWFD